MNVIGAKLTRGAIFVSLTIGLTSCAAPDQPLVSTGPASDYMREINQLTFDPARNAAADVDTALAAARASGKHVLLIMGGDWCHDSIALADLFTSPRFAAMLGARYELVWAHVPRSLDERDPAIARRFGLDSIVGTPTVLILNNQGVAINLADAPRWRNAASRKPEAVYRHFARAVQPVTN